MPQVDNPGMTRVHPLAFALLIAAAYVALLLPILLHDSRDLSFFVIAGDYFVDPHTPILVRPNSFGYDGQFFYRLAVAPFSFDNPAAGIRFDVPVYRSQRFLYPLLAWLASTAQPAAAPAALVATNIAAIALLAGAALTLVRRLALPDATAWAIVAWPGLLVSLTHDTAEIVTVAFLLAALAARAHDRIKLFVLFGIAATLTRETAAPVFAGLFLWDLIALRKPASGDPSSPTPSPSSPSWPITPSCRSSGTRPPPKASSPTISAGPSSASPAPSPRRSPP